MVGSLGHVWLNVISTILGIFPYMTALLCLVLGTVMVVFGAIMIAKPDNLKLVSAQSMHGISFKQ